MTIQQNPKQATNHSYLKMRAAYRAKNADDMEIEIKPEAYADIDTDLLNGLKLREEGLKALIPEWPNLPPPGLKESIQLQIDKGNGKFVDLGDPHEFVIPEGEDEFPPGTFPHEIVIAAPDFPPDAACKLRYILRTYQGAEVESNEKTIYVDQVAPYGIKVPTALQFTGDHLDDDNLPPGSKLRVTFAGYPDWKPGDKVAIYLADSANLPDDPRTLPPIFFGLVPSPGTTDNTIEIDAAKIREFNDTNGKLTYALVDTAMNASLPAVFKSVSLTFGPLPQNLKKPVVPQATPGPLTMAEVQVGVSVWVPACATSSSQSAECG